MIKSWYLPFSDELHEHILSCQTSQQSLACTCLLAGAVKSTQAQNQGRTGGGRYGVCARDEVFLVCVCLVLRGRSEWWGGHVGWCRNCQMPGIGVVAVVAVVAMLAVFCGCW